MRPTDDQARKCTCSVVEGEKGLWGRGGGDLAWSGHKKREYLRGGEVGWGSLTVTSSAAHTRGSHRPIACDRLIPIVDPRSCKNHLTNTNSIVNDTYQLASSCCSNLGSWTWIFRIPFHNLHSLQFCCRNF